MKKNTKTIYNVNHYCKNKSHINDNRVCFTLVETGSDVDYLFFVLNTINVNNHATTTVLTTIKGGRRRCVTAGCLECVAVCRFS